MDEHGSGTAGPGGAAASEDVSDRPPEAIDTDNGVATELVETPPVTIAAAPPPRGPRRVGSRFTVIVGALSVLAIAGVGALGYSLSQDLTATRSSLAASETDLGSTRSTLDDTSVALATTKSELAGAVSSREALDQTIAELSGEVADQTACVVQQMDALLELARISDLQTDNFNRTSDGSTWAVSADKREKAVGNAIDAYYNAYSKAFDGATSAARDWAAKGKDARGVIAAQAKQQLAEFALIDRSAAEIQAALDALETDLAALEEACREVAE
jgi:hypothetical protein